MKLTLAELNAMDRAAWIDRLGWIYEHSPWVAERAWGERPFPSTDALHAAMARIVAAATPEQQIDLIRAHPNLGARLKMTDASVQEQRGAGLDQLSPEEYAEFQSLNEAYMKTFDFPFILAVRGHTKESIRAAMRERLGNSVEEERKTALREIDRIARFRLDDLIEGP